MNQDNKNTKNTAVDPKDAPKPGETVTALAKELLATYAKAFEELAK